jgi:disulfide bond formation protein DsbB
LSSNPPKGAPGAAGGAKIPSHRPPGGTEGQTWHEHGPHADDRISIPGTHVPAWVVVAIVVGVVALLAATAFFLLR